MFLSDRTMRLILESGLGPASLSALLHSLDRDICEAARRDHDPALILAANLAEDGLSADAILVCLKHAGRLWDEQRAPKVDRYVRKMPSNWSDIRARIYERDAGACQYCGDTEGPFHVDHIEPLSRGGSHDDDNLCLACRTCNLSKKDSTVEEWRARTCM